MADYTPCRTELITAQSGDPAGQRPGRIRIIVGEPMLPVSGPGTSLWGETVRLRDAAREFIGRHCGEPAL